MIGSISTCTRCAVLAALVVLACSRADEAPAPRPSPPVAAPSAGSAAQATAVTAAAPAAISAVRPTGAAAPRPRPLSAAAQAGKQLFFDRALSASGKMACATCHDPDHAYGPPGDLAVQLGGPRGTSPGVRAVPSLRYKEFTPGYADLLDNPDGFSTPAPGGGLTWDGRADSLAEQARTPLLSPF